MFAAAALLWYVVVAGPQGGVTSLPTPFDQRDQCLAAVKEYEATKPPANSRSMSKPLMLTSTSAVG